MFTFHSIQARYLAGLFIFITAIFILTEEGIRHWVTPKLVATERALVKYEIEDIIDQIQLELAKIEAQSRTITQTVPLLESDLIDSVVPALVDQYGDPKVFGGGIWPLPQQRSAASKHSTFYHRDASGKMTVNTYWNSASSLNYYEQPWHQAGLRAAAGQCAWAKAYKDDASTEARTNCAMRINKNGRAYGVSTIDLTLGFFNQLATQTGSAIQGKIMVLEHDGTILNNVEGLGHDLVLKNLKQLSSSAFAATASQQLANKNWNKLSTFKNQQGEDWSLFLLPVDNTPWVIAAALPSHLLTQSSFNVLKILTSIQLPLIAILILTVVMALNRLIKRLRVLAQRVQALSSGEADLTRRIHIVQNDEIGAIGKAMNDFIAYLQTLIQEVNTASHAINEEIASLENQTRENQLILNRHANETEQAVTAITEMSSTAASVAQDANRTAEFTRNANTEAERTQASVLSSSQSVRALVTEVDESANSVLKMQDNAQRINDVINVISGIAEQTNLLALNAAIEAARAGEQGRGFAVVADEVRALAGRSQQSAAEIATMLGLLQQDVDFAVSTMERTKESCEQTAEKSQSVNAGIDQMIQSVDEINSLSAQIATAAEEQSAVTEEINKNMVAISSIVTELVASGQLNQSSAQSLANSNQTLSQLIGRFKV